MHCSFPATLSTACDHGGSGPESGAGRIRASPVSGEWGAGTGGPGAWATGCQQLPSGQKASFALVSTPMATEMGGMPQAIFYLPGLGPVGPASLQHLCAVCRVDVQLYLLTHNDGWLRG